MKKLLMIVSAVAVSASAGMAQEVQETVLVEETPVVGEVHPDFRSNWFVSAGAGPQVMFGDHDRQVDMKNRISPALDIAVGKWITPSIGIRLMYSGLYAKGATQNGVFSTGEALKERPWHGYWLEYSKIDFMHLHADVMFDLVNMIGGYKPGRIYNLSFYAGLGYAHTWNKPHKNSITASLGLMNVFHVAKACDVNLDLRASAFQDDFDGAGGRRDFDGLVSVTAGVSYKFGSIGWKTRREVVTRTVYDNGAVNNLRAQVAQLVAENEKLENDLKGKSVTHKAVEYVGGKYIIYFPINVSSLNNADRAQLDMCANAIKGAPEGSKFMITGYADKATGTPEVNEILSRSRAENVRACLVNEHGVDVNRLDVQWKGGVGNMFYDDPTLSRVVIISPIENK